MQDVLLVIHLILALAIIGLVLIQRSEGGGLGIGGGGGGMGNFASARGTANLLTRLTAVCAGLFFCTSLALGVLAGKGTSQTQSILDAIQDEPAAITNTITEDDLEAVIEDSESAPSAPLAE